MWKASLGYPDDQPMPAASSSSASGPDIPHFDVKSLHFQVHADTKCDHCGIFPIIGARYRCLSCDDYDLCAKCFAIAKHYPSHHFVRFLLPLPIVQDAEEVPVSYLQTPLHPSLYPSAMLIH